MQRYMAEAFDIHQRQKTTQRYINIETKEGKMRPIQSFSSTKIQIDEFKSELIVRGEEHFMFVLSAMRYLSNKKIVTYIFVRRKISVVKELIDESLNSEKKQLRGK